MVIRGVHRLPLRSNDEPDVLFRLPARLSAAGVRFCIAAGPGRNDLTRNLPFKAGKASAYAWRRSKP